MTEIKKPQVIQTETPNFSGRNGAKIERIIMHYTTSENEWSTIHWFQKKIAKVSSHYIVCRKGLIYQPVEDENRAWHARGWNRESIGIENCAKPGQTLSQQQESSLITLCRYLMHKYQIPPENVTGHRFTSGSNTHCPNCLFGAPTELALKSWVKTNLT